MSVKENKALYSRWIDEAYNKKNVETAVQEFIDPNMFDHALPPGTPRNLETQKQVLDFYLTAFPDLRPTIDNLIGEGDRVVALLTLEGIHKGEFMGIPPTGNPVLISEIDVVRIANGKFVEHWAQADFQGIGEDQVIKTIRPADEGQAAG